VETPIEPSVTVGGGSFDDVVYHNTGTRQPKFDLRVDQELGGDGKIVYGAGFAQTQGVIHTPIGPFELLDNTRLGYGQVAYTRGGFHATAFANYLSGDAPALVSVDGDGKPLDIDFTNGVYNLDLGWRDLFFNRHLMTFGGNIRLNTFDISIAPDASNQRQAGVYVQDEINLGAFRVAAALRADDYDNFSGINLSPRLALIWTPAQGHTLKLSYNRAFRTPSAIDNHLDISITGGYFPVSEFDPRLEDDFPIVVRTIGNPDLKPEIIDAYEIGYSAVLNSGATRLDLNLYTSDTSDVISYSPSPEALEQAGIDPFYSSENPPEGWPLHPIVLDFLEQMGIRFPSTIQILNIGSIRNRGIEFSARQIFRGGWTLWGNYSFQDEPEMLDPVGDLNRPPSESVSVPPTHRFNLGLAFDSEKYLGSVSVNYSDKAFFAQGLNPSFLGYSDAYTLVGLTLGKRWQEGRVTTSIKVINALDEKARQHVFGDVLRRSVVLEVQLRY
jgi:outer membrane receptor protein involved in Fe transport